MRIAMWSGPRNLSTAMMYSFGARADFAVVDEPFYAAYLAQTGLDHPMHDEVLASQSQDPLTVVKQLMGPVPDGRTHLYQKHMTQHMITGVPRDWARDVVNVFLIRHPARVVASFAAKYEQPTLEDIGFVQQLELYRQMADTGAIVIDSHEIRENPERALRVLCDAIGLPWDAAMLHWPAGGHAADGVWARHWYGAVHRSTGFAGPEGALPVVAGDLAELVDAALPAYRAMEAAKLKI
ncbi:HAD family hydrolase [Rhodobacteraceae bacterium KMM 6894]|nr:HAD family hydrolase [Rhodobacteraceae bacterium KMM 6894]